MATYWQKQEHSKPLFDDLLWGRPEQKSQAGKLLIIGGNSHAIAAPSEAFMLAAAAGAGEIKAVMPDKTRKLLGPKVPADIELVKSTPSGSFATNAQADLQSYMAWADASLFAGDIGRNSETAILLEQILNKMPGLQIYTRDAADYFANMPATVLNREHTLLVLSIAQLQKIAKNAQFSTPITFTMGFAELCHALSELTIANKAYIITQTGSDIVVAVGGQVITTKLPTEPEMWRLKTATYAAVWWLQNPQKPLEAFATAITQIKY